MLSLNVLIIPYDRGAAFRLKKEAAKFNICTLFNPNENIFQRIRSDKDKVKAEETAGVCKISYIDENKQTGCYIGQTKRKNIKKNR